MQSLTLEFEQEESMRAAARELWEKLKLTGEMHLHRTNTGRWRMEIQSERPVRQQTLERISGKVVQPAAAEISADPDIAGDSAVEDE